MNLQNIFILKFRTRPKFQAWCMSLFLFCVVLAFPKSAVAQEKSQRSHPSLLQRFWDIGCEFSGVVTRVRRSTDNPPAPEPNFDDPEELFNYLYPLANVNPGEKGDGTDGESQRSTVSGTHSISSWLEDLMELWHSECHNRREKRSTERRTARSNGRASFDGRLRRKEYAWLSNSKKAAAATTRNSSLANSMRRQGYEDDGYAYDHYNRDEAILEEIEDKEEDKLEEEEEDKDKDKEKEKDKINALVNTVAGLIPPKPTPQKPGINLPSMADNKKEDIFFSQYGGDIEYFFPLLSFGIPFDGEITLLGFHGFRGIFPY